MHAFAHYDYFASLLYSTFPLAPFVRSPVGFSIDDSSLIGFLNGLGWNIDSCALVFGFLRVYVLVTLALLPQTPKRRQGHHVMFCTWLVLKLAQYHDLLRLLQKLLLSNTFLCPGMQLGKPDKLIGQCQLRTAARFLGFSGFCLITVPRKLALDAFLQPSSLSVVPSLRNFYNGSHPRSSSTVWVTFSSKDSNLFSISLFNSLLAVLSRTGLDSLG